MSKVMASQWTVWLHRKDDASWGEESYHRICDLSTPDEFWPKFNGVAHFVGDAQFFIFRKGVGPRYEDPANQLGGCISLKLDRRQVVGVLEEVLCKALEEVLVPGNTGVSVAPKGKHFIVKIWLASCVFNMADVRLNASLKALARFSKHVCA